MVSSQGQPSACSRDLAGNETHAWAEAFIFTWGLAGILKCDMVAGAVPAGAELSPNPSRSPNFAAGCPKRRFRPPWFLIGHTSSLGAYPARSSSFARRERWVLASSTIILQRRRTLFHSSFESHPACKPLPSPNVSPTASHIHNHLITI